MAYITLGGASELVIKVPTIGSTDWADTMRTDTFLKIAQHDHTGSGSGAQLSTGSFGADSVTDTKIRLDNNGYLKSRNAADTDNINLVKINASDKIEFGAEVGVVLNIVNNVALQHRNAADAAYIATIKVNASDKIALGADLANASMIGNTYLTGRNNADSAYIDMIKVNTSDKLALGADLANASMIGNTYLTGRNNADSGYIDMLKVGTDDKIAFGATILSATMDAASVTTTSTSLIDTLATAVTLADNQAAVTAGVVTLSTDESCAVHYRIVRNGVTQSGVLRFTDTETIPSEVYTGTDVGVTFTVNAGDLEYATTSTGSTGSLTYVVIKE